MSNTRGNASIQIRPRVHKVNETKLVRLSLVIRPRFSRERDYRHTARIAPMMASGKDMITGPRTNTDKHNEGSPNSQMTKRAQCFHMLWICHSLVIGICHSSFLTVSQYTTFLLRPKVVSVRFLILVWINNIVASHRHTERTQRV